MAAVMVYSYCGSSGAWLLRRLVLPVLILLGVFLLALIAQLVQRARSPSLEHFAYPLDVDLVDVVERELSGRKLPSEIWPINSVPQRVLLGSSGACVDAEVLILVKTVHEARANRMAIRQTWGRADCLPPLNLRVVFLLGTHTKSADEEDHLRAEQALHRDIIQFDFSDAYEHNTYKMLAGMQFAVRECRKAVYLVMMDDDYILNPWRLAAYLRQVSPVLQPRLVAGWVYYGALPRRHWADKWRISSVEYPYSQYPAYPTAGTVVLSKEIAKNLTIAAKYVRYMAFDDVYLGILLHKMHLLPVHSRLMWWQDPPVAAERLSRYISSHGFRNPDQLRRAWHLAGLSHRCAMQSRIQSFNKRTELHQPPVTASTLPKPVIPLAVHASASNPNWKPSS